MTMKDQAATVVAIKGLLSDTWADGYEAGRRAAGTGGGAVNPFEGGCRWCASVEGCFCDGDGNPPANQNTSGDDEAYWLTWGYPYAQQGRIAKEIADAYDTGGHDDPVIDRAWLLMGEDDVEDLWDAYVRACDGMTPCPEHSDPECHLCEPLDNPRGVWLAPGQKAVATA